MNEKILEIKDLHISFKGDHGKVCAVNGVSLSIGKKEVLGLVGETGAGKTTTALGIMRLVPAPQGSIDQGEILFEGQDLTKVSQKAMRSIRGNQIAMIFQDPMTSLNPVLTVGDQLEEVISLHQKLSKQDIKKKAREMLEMVGIPGHRESEYPHQFSGGMKQRVMIAIALACNPSLLIADEPTTALDVTIQAQVLELMQQLKETLDTSMLMITHDLGVVAEVCDKVAVMYAGKIVEHGTLRDIYTNPSHPYTQGLFQALPDLDQDTDRLTPIEGSIPDPTNLPVGCKFAPRCPYRTQKCEQEEPGVYDLSDTHQSRCWRCDPDWCDQVSASVL